MRLSARRWRRQLMAVAAALLVGAAYGQDFSDASMNGIYAFVVEPQTEAGQAAPTHGRWLLVLFNRVPDDVTGALRMGRGTLQKPMAEGP